MMQLKLTGQDNEHENLELTILLFWMVFNLTLFIESGKTLQLFQVKKTKTINIQLE